MRLRLNPCIVAIAITASVLFARINAQDVEIQAEMAKLMSQVNEADERGDSEQQISLFRLMLEKVEPAFGKNSRQEVTLRRNFAMLHRRMGRLDEAKEKYQEAISFTKTAFGDDSIELTPVLLGLAGLLVQQGEYQSASDQIGIAIRIAKVKEDSKTLSSAFGDLAKLQVLTGDMKAAAVSHQSAVKYANDAFGSEADSYLIAAIDYGSFLVSLGDLEGAARELLAVRKIVENQISPNRFLIMRLQRALIDTDIKLFNLESAAVSLRELISEIEKIFPAGTPVLNDSRIQLGELLTDLQNYEGSENVLRQTLREISQSGGPKVHAFSMVTALAILADNLLKQGKRDEAVELLSQAIALDRQWLPPSMKRAELGWSFNYLKLLDGNYGEIEGSIRELEQEFSSKLGQDHPTSNLVSNAVARSLHGQGKSEDAANWYDVSRRRSFRNISESLFAQYESTQWYLFENQDKEFLNRALQFAVENPNDSAIQERAVEWLANGKGMIETVRGRFTRAIRESKDPAMVRDAARMDENRKKITSIRLAQTVGPTEEARAQLRLQAEAVEFENLQLTLKLRSMLGEDEKMIPWVTYQSIRDSVGENRCLVDIFKVFAIAPNEETTTKSRYIAWVTDSTGTSVHVLGDADEIDKMVTDVADQLADSKTQISQLGGRIAETKIRELLQNLSRSIIGPIESKIKKNQRLEISVDAEMWRVPWPALVLSDGKYLAERHDLEMLTSARSLIPNQQESTQAREPVLFADPEFGKRSERSEGTDEDLLRGFAIDLNLGSLSKLAGTMRDARSLADAFSKIKGVETSTIFTGSKASAENFLQIRNPRYLLIATHGFYVPYEGSYLNRPDSPERILERISANSHLTEIGDPMLRSGLMFAGSNQGTSLSLRSVVTARDILTLDLRGCKLVLLSSCESGVGEYRHGGGVAGLRQAFLLAGAQKVLSTQWSISDQYTGLLMEDFGKEFQRTNDEVASLGLANREMIKRLRENKQDSHPYYWAAFSITR